MDILEISKALGDENRLRILNLLMSKDLCVCEIEAMLDMMQSNVSRHLHRLKNAGVITSEKRSQWVYYKVDPHFITEHALLYQYLQEKFMSIMAYQADRDRLDQYQASEYTCEDISRDKKEFHKMLGID